MTYLSYFPWANAESRISFSHSDFWLFTSANISWLPFLSRVLWLTQRGDWKEQVEEGERWTGTGMIKTWHLWSRKSIKTGAYVFTQDGQWMEEVFQGRVSWRPPRGEGMGTWLFVEEFQQAYLGGLKQESISGGRNSNSNGTEVGKGRWDWGLNGNKSINFDWLYLVGLMNATKPYGWLIRDSHSNALVALI